MSLAADIMADHYRAGPRGSERRSSVTTVVVLVTFPAVSPPQGAFSTGRPVSSVLYGIHAFMEIDVKDHFGVTPLALRPSFMGQLKGKSRRRRKDLARMAKTEASPRALRNDLLPRLELALVPLERLKMPAPEVRKLHPAHVSQVADSVGALGFCAPILIGKDNLSLMAQHALMRRATSVSSACRAFGSSI